MILTLKLAELEDHRKGVGNLNCAVTLFAGLPLGGAGNYANGFLVQGFIHATEYAYVGNAAVGLYGELQGYTALNAVFLCNFRIYQTGVNPLGELVGIASVEGRLLFYQLERNGFFFHLFLFHGCFLIVLDFYGLVVVFKVDEQVVVQFDIVVHNVDLVAEDRD